MIVSALREIVERRNLLFMITWRDIRVKYKESVMGILWAVLMPIVIVCAGMIVKLAFAMMSGKHLHLLDVTSVAVKAAPYAFLNASIRFGTASLVTNQDLVTKIYLPRLVFPLSAICSQLFDFAIASVVVSIFLAFAGVGASPQLLWLPLLFVTLILLASGFAILLSATTLFLRDVRFLVEAVLTLAIFFTPVFYEPSIFGKWAPLVLINPLAPILEGFSAVVIGHRAPSLPWTAYSTVFSLALFMFAVARFKRIEPLFAENI
jgi:ABC-type polysaccharide/polyol phosphate export permease